MKGIGHFAIIRKSANLDFHITLYVKEENVMDELKMQNGEKTESHLHTFHFCGKIGRAKITETK